MEGGSRGGAGTRLMLLAGKAGFYPERGTEYKEVSRLAGGASQEEREELVAAADGCASGLTASAWETLPPAPPAGCRVGRDACGEVSWRCRSEHCQGLL